MIILGASLIAPCIRFRRASNVVCGDVGLDEVGLGPKSVLWVAFCFCLWGGWEVEGIGVRDGPKSAEVRVMEVEITAKKNRIS